MSYADIVQPSEMQDAKAWLSQMLALLRRSGTGNPRAEVKSATQGWERLKFNRSVTNGVLCLHGNVYPTGFGTHARSGARCSGVAQSARRCRFRGLTHP